TEASAKADIFRGIMVSLYVKEKENGHVKAYAPTGAMGLKRWGGLTSKFDGLPVVQEVRCPQRTMESQLTGGRQTDPLSSDIFFVLILSIKNIFLILQCG
ncbi:MAG: hypothetical protein MR709_02670, partial [Bacteroidales bacterium]|nr:hypothetical protein [Bacteroidales bacterium]